MKTKFWLVLLAVLLAVSLGLSALLLRPGKGAEAAEIYSRGKYLYTVSLRQDQEFTVTTDLGFNTVTVSGGAIAVTQASCPDHYCMKRGFCAGGTEIVCLPNQLVIRFAGEVTVDAAVG